MSVSRPPSSAFVAGHDAPLIGERAAMRRRSATEGGDERAGAKNASSVRAPASRTASNGRNLDALAATRPTEASAQANTQHAAPAFQPTSVGPAVPVPGPRCRLPVIDPFARLVWPPVPMADHPS